MMRNIQSAKMNGVTSIRLAANFDAAIPRHWQELYPHSVCYRAFPKSLPPLDGWRHSRQTQNAEPAAGTVLAHWSNSSRATRYRVFKQIDGVDAIPVNVNTVTDSDATLTAQPSGKTLKVYVIAANDAGQAAPSDTVTIVVP